MSNPLSSRLPSSPSSPPHLVAEGAGPPSGPAAPATERLLIEQVADLTGLTRRTIRYWEEQGILDKAERTDGNYRVYTMADVERLRHVIELKRLMGASLAQIRALVLAEEERTALREAYHHEQETAAKLDRLERLRQVTIEQLRMVERRAADLEQLRQTYRQRLERYQAKIAELESDQPVPDHSARSDAPGPVTPADR